MLKGLCLWLPPIRRPESTYALASGGWLKAVPGTAGAGVVVWESSSKWARSTRDGQEAAAYAADARPPAPPSVSFPTGFCHRVPVCVCS